MAKDIRTHKNEVAIVNNVEDIEMAVSEGDFSDPDHRPDDPEARIRPGETADEVEERLSRKGKLKKYRVYVDNEDEVPDEYEVQEGAQGGLYYEVGNDDDYEFDESDLPDAVADKDVEFAENVADMAGKEGVEVFGALYEEFGRGSAMNLMRSLENDWGQDNVKDALVEDVFNPTSPEEIDDLEVVAENYIDEHTAGETEQAIDEAVASLPDNLNADAIEDVLVDIDDADTAKVFGEITESWGTAPGLDFLNNIEGGMEVESALEDAADGFPNQDFDPQSALDTALKDPTEQYDVDTSFGGDVAEAVANGNVVSTIPAQQWRDNTGQINDDDLLLDALDQIVDDGTKTAKDRIRQRLRSDDFDYTDEEIDEFLSDDSDGEFTEADHEQWQEEFELPPQDEVDNRESLYDHDDADTGVTAQAMEVMELEDGNEAFITHYEETGAGQKPPTIASRADPENRDRQMVTYKGGNLIGDELGIDTEGAVPPHKEGPDGAWVAVESFDGDSVWELDSRREIDAEHAMENAAVQMILGNNDLHAENVLVNEDGEFSFIDLDHSAGDLTDDDPAGFAQKNGERAFDRIADTLNKMAANSSDLTPDGAPGEEYYIIDAIHNRCEEMAAELNNDEFKEQLRGELAWDYHTGMVENIIANIENFADPDTEVPH